MKTTNLKVWDTFYNSNGYLCIVYRIRGGKASVVNYNASFYNITIDDNERPNYSLSVKPPEEFFTDFPMKKFYDREAKMRLINIIATYKEKIQPKRKRFLLLCSI